MNTMIADIRLIHRVVGSKHVYTSPDVPGLHVSHVDQETARNSVQDALDMMERMRQRAEARRQVQVIQSERLYA